MAKLLGIAVIVVMMVGGRVAADPERERGGRCSSRRWR